MAEKLPTKKSTKMVRLNPAILERCEALVEHVTQSSDLGLILGHVDAVIVARVALVRGLAMLEVEHLPDEKDGTEGEANAAANQ